MAVSIHSASSPLRVAVTRRLGNQLRAHAVFVLVLLVMLITATICLVHAAIWLGKPFPGFFYFEFPAVGSYANSEWPAMRAGIRYRDVILEINGQKISSGRDIERLVERAGVGNTLRYLIDKKGERVHVEIPVATFGLDVLLQSFVLPFTAGLVFWLLGVIVYLLKPKTPTSWAFFLFCLSIGTYSLTGFQIQSDPEPPWYDITAVSMSFIPAAALHLSLFFPERTRWVQKWPWLPFVPYAFSLLLTIYHSLDVAALRREGLNPDDIVRISAHMLTTVHVTRFYTVLAAVALLAAAAHAFLRSRSVIAKQRARVVLLGAGLAFLPAVLAMAALTKLLIPLNLLNLPILVFPAAVAYAIARHNLFDVDVYVKRALGYGIMSAIVGMSYFAMQALLGPAMLGSLFGPNAERAYPFVFALLVVFLFNPVSRRVQESVDRIFFRKKFDYKQTISAVSDVLTSMLNLDQIIEQVIHTVRKEMFVDTAGVIVLGQPQNACRSVFVGETDRRADGDQPTVRVHGMPVHYDDPLLALVRQQKTLITRYDIEEDSRYQDARETCLPRFAELAASMVIPLLYHDQVTGILAVGNKKSGQFYTREDVDLLSTMANQAAVAIQNATTHEKVVHYAAELEASLRRIQILESIKSNLAKFVPKTVQDLIEEAPQAPLLDKREVDVSVLFADMAGYTRLSAQMELDQVNKIVERYFGAFLDEIMRYGGDVNETAGDGIMVIFRKKDPRKHARAAVLAASGIQRRTREINAQSHGQLEPVTMRVGVNSGIAAVGATKIEGVAGTRWTYTASGPTTNVAARLAALAEGGSVILSEETRHRMGDEFEVEDLGPQSLKNVPHPVRAFRLTVKAALGPSEDVEVAAVSPTETPTSEGADGESRIR